MIRWTDREWMQLAEWLVAHDISPDRHGWRTNFVQAMVACLPKERHRPLHSLNETKRAIQPFLERLKLVKKPVSGPEKVESGPQNGLTTEFLLVELAKRLAAWLERPYGPVYDPVDRGFHPPPEAKSQVRHTTFHKPRILVIGPINGQQRELELTHRMLDLRFVASDEGPTRIDEVGPSCDEIILWTNYINHQHQVHAKATKRPTYYVTGGISSIHARLLEWVPQ